MPPGQVGGQQVGEAGVVLERFPGGPLGEPVEPAADGQATRRWPENETGSGAGLPPGAGRWNGGPRSESRYRRSIRDRRCGPSSTGCRPRPRQWFPAGRAIRCGRGGSAGRSNPGSPHRRSRIARVRPPSDNAAARRRPGAVWGRASSCFPTCSQSRRRECGPGQDRRRGSRARPSGSPRPDGCRSRPPTTCRPGSAPLPDPSPPSRSRLPASLGLPRVVAAAERSKVPPLFVFLRMSFRGSARGECLILFLSSVCAKGGQRGSHRSSVPCPAAFIQPPRSLEPVVPSPPSGPAFTEWIRCRGSRRARGRASVSIPWLDPACPKPRRARPQHQRSG